MAEFKLNGQTFQAKRISHPFLCHIDGMKLKGFGMDWCITRPDGKSFPMQDHIFKMLFEPVDEEAKKLFNAKYTLRVGLTEGLTLADHVADIVTKLKGKAKQASNPGP